MNPPCQIRKIVLFFALLALVAIAAAETNDIQIFVHPGSGNVCLDNTCQVDRGTLAGYSSTRFEDITGGQFHTIRVYDTEGYQDATEQVYMDYAGNPITREIYLEPLPTGTPEPETGTLQVFVSPGLGQVCLDNRECESSVGAPSTTWSVRFSDVASDTAHTITVTADGYQTSTTQVTIQQDQVNEVDITLQPLAGATSSGSPQTPSPRATRAAPEGSTILFAAGISCAVFLFREKRH